MEIKAPKQSDHEAQQVQQSMINNEPTILTLSNGKKVKIGWLMPVTNDKIDSIIVEHDETAKLINDGKISKAVANKKTRQHFAKITAAILLNDQIKLALFWWIKWRIIYYRWRITGEDHKNIIAEAKKKSQESQYLVAMAYSMTMADIWTMMTKKEAEVFLRELNSAKGQQQ